VKGVPSSCAATYCHGATLSGGTRLVPTWALDPSQIQCDSCHGMPPPPSSGHPRVPVTSPVAKACNACHPGTVRPDGSLDAAGGYHLNGYVEVSNQAGQLSTCTSCHGANDKPAALQPAPPHDLSGNTATTAMGVGAHDAHLKDGAYSRAFACSECHEPVASTDHAAGHDLQVKMSFGPLASNEGSWPVWDPVAGTCASVYCHGNTMDAAPQNPAWQRRPIWNKVDGTQAACGTCHGVPPPPPHVDRIDCGSCHAGYTSASVNLRTHVDGVVQAGSLTCTSCHGDPNRSPATTAAAPPSDSAGGSATTRDGVGAHLQHLLPGPVSKGVACAECHPVPTNNLHADGTVHVVFGPLARTGGATPGFDPVALTCATTYCHGATLPSGASGARPPPAWTQVNGTFSTCASCHGNPPSTATGHPASNGQDCGQCHAGYTASSVNLVTHLNGVVDQTASCASCHGDPSRIPAAGQDPRLASAPPRDTDGDASSTFPGVGAHQAHLAGNHLRAPLGCTDCHAVPADLSNHPNGTLDLTWGALAKTGGARPAYDDATASCATTYCHGATLPDAPARAPIWTRVDGSFRTCTSCHGSPPPISTGHPAAPGGACGGCHAGYSSSTVNLALHINGVVEATAGCTDCHGDPSAPAAIQAAPPKDTTGSSATASPGVGAHQAHLRAGPLSVAFACTECHRIPKDSAHATQPLDLTFGPLATAGGAAPVYDDARSSCSASYCHGGSGRPIPGGKLSLTGGSNPAPIWNRVDGTQAACGTCHGTPPPLPHPTGASCGGCHAGYTATTVNLAAHVNGVLDVTGTTSCTACHGDSARTAAAGQDPQLAAAPPKDSAGNSTTTAPGVGAHLSHLVAGKLRGPLACTECHAVPGDSAHATQPLQLTFGPLARSASATPVWSGAALTCATTYCHGATLPDANRTPPIWNRVDGTFLGCTSCHANPPPTTAGHPASSGSDCASCHPGYTSKSVNLATHINGVVDAATSCTACHGSASAPAAIQAAPPKDTTGSALTTSPGVGAHQAHLQAGSLSAAFACTECHRVPADSAHATLPLDLTWGPLATTGGAKPTYDDATASCAASYCHGGTTALKGGTLTRPVWNKVDGTQAACGTCHGAPPPAPHVRNTACGGCHAGYTATAVGAAALATHVNGVVDTVVLACTTCHGDAARTLVTGADAKARAAPPRDTAGATTGPGVGLHLNHLNQAKLGKPVACSECHPVPSSMTHANGTVQVAFGTLSKTGGKAPVWNATALSCAATYCHAPPVTTSGGFTAQTPTWTQTTPLTCATCHPSPPNDRCHPPNFNHGGGNKCSSCHKDTNSAGTAITNTTLHMNGVVDGKCSDCHGGQSCTP
jgi:predicted CxxxxCH...CXXCH cytochrome family protein